MFIKIEYHVKQTNSKYDDQFKINKILKNKIKKKIKM
jgi:hypothetical protein